MDDLVMARLEVLKHRHEQQMLATEEQPRHAQLRPTAHACGEADKSRSGWHTEDVDHHAPDHRVHKLQPDAAAVAVGQAESDGCGGTWREVTSTGKWAPLTLDEVRAEQAKFSVERNWTQFHKPRNILAALTSEVGELTEGLGLWRDVGFGGEGLTAEEKHHVGEEITDCLVYLLRLADVLDVDLPAAVKQKMEKNNDKYLAHMVYGSSKKYNKY